MHGIAIRKEKRLLPTALKCETGEGISGIGQKALDITKEKSKIQERGEK